MDRYIRLHLTIICLLIVGSSSAANYYWIGGSGNWNDTLHWSATSGGVASYSIIPTSIDDVFIDNNSGLNASDTIQLYFIMNCHTLTIDSLPFNLQLSSNFSNLTVYGDISISTPVDFKTTSIELEPSSLTSNIYAPYTTFNSIKVPIANCTINLLCPLNLLDALDLIYPFTIF